MTWQGAGGSGGGGQDPDPEDATRVDWAAPAQPPAGATPTPEPGPFAPGGPLADDAALAAQQGAVPPAPPSAPPAAPPSLSGPPPSVPWAAPQPDAAWAAPASGGRFAVPGAPGLVYAGAVPRLAAWITDAVLLGIVTSILAIPFAQPVNPGQVGDLSQLIARGQVGAVISLVVDAAYFILLWGSGGRGTLGMRLFKIQIGDATTGNRISYGTGVKRWLALGSWLGLAALVPTLAGLGGGLQLIWNVLLLITVATSATKQGIHDRIAGTALVRPASAGNGLAWGCLAIFVIIPLLLGALFIPLIFLGGQVSDILSAVGESI